MLKICHKLKGIFMFSKDLRRRDLTRRNTSEGLTRPEVVYTSRTSSGERATIEVNAEIIRKKIEEICRGIADDPNNCFITMYSGPQTFVFSVTCSKEDIGKLIGKHGRMAESIRNILYALCSKVKIRGVLEIEG
jgi:predicted RNA-binding protein YlqC (UPF0109 family)